MSARRAVADYLDAFRLRLRSIAIAWGVFALAAGTLLLTLLAVRTSSRFGFADSVVAGWRIGAVVCLATAAYLLLWRSLQRLDARRTTDRIESGNAALGGRLETYLDHTQPRTGETPPRTPVLELLELDIAERLRTAPLDVALPPIRLRLPAAFAVIAVLLWLALLTLGPAPLGAGARHLWFGWAFDRAEAPIAIEVTPGDSAMQRGLDLAVAARFSGFDPATAELFVRSGDDAEWQHAPMRRNKNQAFEFTLYAVQQPLSYYVAAGPRRSPEYRIDVVDLPRVEKIRVSYTYPVWSGLAPETVDPGGPIRALPDTRVRLEVTFDRPPSRGELVLNEGAPVMLEADAAELTVTTSGSYYIADYFGDRQVRLTEDFPIAIVDDQKPAIEAIKPGRDFRASNIEEVQVRFKARDDFALDAVRLHYSVNGGDWQQVTLPAPADDGMTQHVLALEELGALAEETPYLLPQLEADEEPEGDAAAVTAPRRLSPGDIITYYAEATDRQQLARTDLFLIQVQPFDRRFSQSQQAGGGGGGGGQQEEEISDRQKEILLATWNLIRRRDDQRDGAPEQIDNNALMLAEMQRTLADQAQTLVQRSRSRELTTADDSIRLFIQNLENAVEAMRPAAERLAEVELQDAIAPEQRALQFLLHAEALFSDIEVSLARGGDGGGGGGRDAADFAEMFELEMDLDKNQYETGSTPSLGSADNRELDETIRKLQDLARRQEQLANQANRASDLTMAQRWQQEMLRREAEELREQLQQLQRGQQQQQESSPAQANGGATQEERDSGNAELSQQTMERLDRAVSSMEQAGTQANMSPEQMRRAIEEAGRELQQALDELRTGQRRATEQAFNDVSQRADEAYREQQRLDVQLQQALDNALAEREENDSRLPSGLTAEQEYDLAERKDELLNDYRELEQRIQQAMLDHRAQAPRASERLEQAIAEMQQFNVATRLDVARQGIERGLAPQIAAIEGITTSALRDLSDAAAEAADLAQGEIGQQRQTPQLADSLTTLQELRRGLTEGPIGDQTGDQQGAREGAREGAQGEAPGGARPDDQGQRGAAGGGARGFAYRSGNLRDSGWTPPERWDDLSPANREAIQEQLQDTAREALRIATQLEDAGPPRPEDAETVRQLRELSSPARAGRHQEIVERQYLDMLALIEQLELSVQDRISGSVDTARAAPPDTVLPDLQEPVAEYYERLSR